MRSETDWLILIVEDEQDSVMLFQSIFNYHHVQTLAATNAEEALAILDNAEPTLMLIDLNLPGMNGWDLLDIIRQNPETEHLPAVAITAYHDPIVEVEALTAGFDAFFPKPINAASFYQALQTVIMGET